MVTCFSAKADWKTLRLPQLISNMCVKGVGLLLLLLSVTSVESEPEYNKLFKLPEDAEIGHFVGIVEGPDYSPPFTQIRTDLTNALTLASFNVDLDLGRITTKLQLDRETQEEHIIILRTKVVGQKRLIIVKIRLLDINDIVPTFSKPVFSKDIPETVDPKTSYKIPLGSVSDEDVLENSTKTVEIYSGNDENTFSLKIWNRGNVDKTLDLVVIAALDYEHKKVYNLVIRATDGGGRYADMTVTIHVLDANDNEPIFNQSKYSASVNENITVGTTIVKVEATDRDSDENGRITYLIDSKTDPEGFFAINPDTGEVTVERPLDFEKNNKFVLTLEARDNGADPLSGSTALDVIVRNINEQPANISMAFKPEFRQGYVSENTPVDTVIAVITIDDPDSDMNRNVDVNLYGGLFHFTLVEDQDLSSNQLDLVVLKSLDREQVASYEMNIVVTDKGTPPLSANREFRIIIQDVNDNTPMFEMSQYEAVVEETAEIGNSVLKVSATDIDLNENGRITYRIQDHTERFTVDSNTGVITTKATMNCDDSPQMLVIVATDGGTPPKMATATVTVSIRDVNEKEPEFDTSFYSIKIAEDRRVGDCILTVSNYN